MKPHARSAHAIAMTLLVALVVATLVPTAALAKTQKKADKGRWSSKPDETTVMVGAELMHSSKTIMRNLKNSNVYRHLVTALEATGLDDMLGGTGTYTVFAPWDAAFGALPPGTVDVSAKPADKEAVKNWLNYEIVAGRYMSKDLIKLASKNDGKVVLKTLQGEDLTVLVDGTKLSIVDARGHTAKVTVPDAVQYNGTVFVVDGVPLP
jgi:uncharacterized surface protein with fasciclin (FAS1) repeats